MTFRRMAFQIFKANFRRYLLFFLCSSFTIMIYFSYYMLYTNPQFNNPYEVNGMISGNLTAPLYVIRAFSVLLIIYAQTTFVKFRKSEFGLFMVLGMSTQNIRKIMLLENGLIAIISIVTGLVAGTVFAPLFYLIVSQMIDMGNVSFTLTLDSYLYTALFFGAVYVIAIAGNLLLTWRYSIVRLLKEKRTADRSLIHGKVPGFIGIALLGFAVYDLLSHLTIDNSNIIFRSMAISMFGIFLLLSSLGDWIKFSLSRSPKAYHKHMVFSSDLSYTLGRSRIILLLITILITFSLFLSSMVLFLSNESQKNAVKHNPYHIAYLEVFGKNRISDETLNEIVDKGTTPLTTHQVLEYIELFPTKVFLDQNINALTGSTYQVEQDHFLNLALVDQTDGYENNIPVMPTYDIELASGKKTLLSQGSIVSMLFNRLPLLTNGLQIIVSEQDYTALQALHPEIGQLHLLNFKNWKQTAAIDAKLNTALAKYNKDNTDTWYGDDRQDAFAFGTGSRIGELTTLKQANQFGLFLFAFVALLFIVSSAVVLHFSILMDLEREKIKYRKLAKIGMTSKEAAAMMVKPFRLLFILPYVLSIVFATFYFVYMVKVINHKALEPLGLSLLAGSIYLVLQLLFYLLYTRLYTRKMLAVMGLDINS
ncbi:FtsX-like permease family protein [Paenibacillus monticola]|uniref:FtsX-like permease family protein n=1 Tax=Paenibacillus monticola TaxID=2666075 RepID=A0A7X2L158_9BACL|nr:ABC transporter permease [Paenibacillus monticola]MRN53482.1 FtsX-like permease family protein [Paenibacillus monticola]